MGYFDRHVNHTSRKERKQPIPEGYSAHFSFVTRRLRRDIEVNEDYLMTKLRDHYHLDVIEVLMKGYQVESDGSQSGYGFLRFNDLAQTQSAVRNLRGITLDNIKFDCSLSERTEEKINASASTEPRNDLPRSSSLSTELDNFDGRGLAAASQETVQPMGNNAVTNTDHHGNSSFHPHPTIISPEIHVVSLESSYGTDNDGKASAAKATTTMTRAVLPPTAPPAPPAFTASHGMASNFVQQPPPYGGDMYYGGAPSVLPPWLPNYYRRDDRMVYGPHAPSPPVSYPVNYHPSWEAQQQQQVGYQSYQPYQPYQAPMNPYYGQAGAHSYQHPMPYWKRA
eukprot:gene10114-11195_t